MRVFITGATGFVGGHVARAYASQGASLRLLTRQTSRLDSLSGIDADTVVGDLREPEKLRSALTGCDALVHVAADYRLWVRDPAQMYAANVDGTRELLKIAREVGIPRAVYTSSVATMGFKADGSIVNEDTAVSLADMIGPYKRSKFLGEQEAIRAAQSGQHVMILNPTTPIGPGDAKPTPTGRIIVDFLNKRFPAYVDTGLNLVDVAEVARMHVIALERGTPGERYILGGENVTIRELAMLVLELTGRRAPIVSVPRWLVRLTARIAIRLNLKLSFNPHVVPYAMWYWFVDSAKARTELGVSFRGARDTIADALAWLERTGQVKARSPERDRSA